MVTGRFIKKERALWHRHFLPSLLAGLVVALIAYLYEGNVSNIILFASVGASAVILMNTSSRHLTKLYTAISAYIIAVVVSTAIYFVNYVWNLSVPINLFLIVFLVGLFLYLFNSFHPPAITAAVSFILLDRPLVDLLWLFLAIIILLVIVRFIVYVFIQNLSLKKFGREFRTGFDEEVEKSL